MGFQSAVNNSLYGLAALTRFSTLGDMAKNNYKIAAERKEAIRQTENANALNTMRSVAAGKETIKSLRDDSLTSEQLKEIRDKNIDISNQFSAENLKNRTAIAQYSGKAKDIDAAVEAEFDPRAKYFNNAISNLFDERISKAEEKEAEAKEQEEIQKALAEAGIKDTRAIYGDKGNNVPEQPIVETPVEQPVTNQPTVNDFQPNARQSFSPRQRATQMLQDEVNNRQLQRAGNRWLLDNLRDRMGGNR